MDPTDGGGLRAADASECQLQILGDGATTLAQWDHLRGRLLRVRSYLVDHLAEARKRLNGRLAGPVATAATARLVRTATPLKPGDVVDVRSLEEVRQTLDASDRCGGLKFMKPMAAHCGRRYVVLTNVRQIFDEHHERMLRLRRTVILRDVICHGLYVGALEGCDRCCFFFWKEDWLRKVETGSNP